MRRRTAIVAAAAVVAAALGLGVATQLRTGEEQAPPRSPITRTPHPPCHVKLHSGADLGPYENGDAYRGAVVCLGDGDYALHRPQHTAGVKVYALHRYQARVWGWIEAYGAGEEWHGVSFNNCRGYTPNPGGCSNPGFAGGTTQAMQVYADDFVFVDGELTNRTRRGRLVPGQAGCACPERPDRAEQDPRRGQLPRRDRGRPRLLRG